MKYLLILSILISGCYSVKKADRQLDRANEEYPGLVAMKTSRWYPCKEGRIISDSVAYKKWMQSIDSLFNQKDTIVDTITLTKIDSSNCENCIKALAYTTSLLNKANKTISLIKAKTITLPAIHDTIIKIDSAQIVIISEEKKKAEKEKEKYQSKYDFWFKLGISFLVAFLISLIFNMLKHIK